MTVQILTDLDVAFGWDSNESAFADLKSVVQELQGIHLSVVSGDAYLNAMTVSGIGTSDTILSAFEARHDAAAAAVDRTASTYVSASGYVKCNEALNASSQFFVLWMNKTGPRAGGNK